MPEALDWEEFIGSCDWGHCNHLGYALRWDSNRQQYLTVCRGHANTMRYGRHDKTTREACEAWTSDATTTVTGSTTDGSPTSNSPSAQEGST
jgi:hypothetical protein